MYGVSIQLLLLEAKLELDEERLLCLAVSAVIQVQNPAGSSGNIVGISWVTIIICMPMRVNRSANGF